MGKNQMALTRSSSLLRFIAILAAMPLGACAVGPNFKRPDAPQVSGYTASPLSKTNNAANVAGGEAQDFVTSQDIPGEWWTLFHSEPLNALIEYSLKNNPNIKAAQAALLVAKENVLVQEGAFFPSVGAGFSASRSQTSDALSTVPFENDFLFNLYTPQVFVSYSPDVFGLNRRSVEAVEAQAEQQHYALAATHITLSANVVAAAIQEASLRAQIDATNQLIKINTDMAQVLRTQFAKGYASGLDLAAQEAQLAQISATLPPLLKQLAQQRDLLAALSGGFLDVDFTEWYSTQRFELSSLQLPQQLPVSLPSQLVEQRPDVRQAEENLHAASAQIGVAIANRLPSFTIFANAGTAALAVSQMFAPGVGFWTLGQSVLVPVFQGGALMHKERAAEAAYVQAAEQYRATVLTAFQNVADTLNALEQDADSLKAAAAAEAAARTTLDLAQRQYRAGYSNYLTLLNAEQAYQQALMNLVQAQANRYADTAALFLALGGGWWNRADLARS